MWGAKAAASFAFFMEDLWSSARGGSVCAGTLWVGVGR